MKNQVIIHDASSGEWLHFKEPRQVVEACRIDEVLPMLRLLEEKVRQDGLYAAGFISYEAAPAFDTALVVRQHNSFPLLRFGLYSPPEVFQLPSPSTVTANTDCNWTPTVSRTEYTHAIAQIKDLIARGETYQVNYTFRLQTPFSGDTWDFFLELVQAQQADYSAYIDTGRFTICSVSPEMFFQLDGSRLVSRPMKGTAARGRTLSEDEAQAEWLFHSEKNRAENVMILDMIRNDIGRIANVGSVEVSGLFNVERYPTLLQMTSTAEATTDAPITDIMTALFPCASITGAPKPNTMKIIAGLETTPRLIYTGTVGFFTPDRKAQFNVAIRTVLVDRAEGCAEYGVGGGIVWDSVGSDEYSECLVKARVLTEKRPVFSFLETLLWKPEDGYFLLDYHLRRLSDSAAYFKIPADMDKIRGKLSALADSLPGEPHRVRLLLSQNGEISCRATSLAGTTEPQPVRLRLAQEPVDSTGIFLYHKTTHRQVYDSARAACPGCDDVLLWNERGEITETSIANVVVRLDGELVTPPVSCGLLPGTFRAMLLDSGEVAEKVIKIETLRECGQIYLVNSVRKWRTAVLNYEL